MKIAHILSQTHLTGAEVYAAQLSQKFVKEGHDVWIFSDTFQSKTSVPFIPLKVHDASFLDRLQSAKRLRQFLIEKNIQVIHTHSRAAVKVASLARIGLPVAMVSTIHGRQHPSIGKRFFKNYGERLICVCANLKSQMCEQFGYKNDRIAIIPNPVSIPTDIIATSKNTQTLRIALIGRTSGPKGEKASTAIETVFPDILNQYPNLEFDIIGGKFSELSPKAQQILSTSPRMKFIENVPQLVHSMTNYDLILGAGRVAIESISLGIPTIAFGEYDCPGLVTQDSYPEMLKSNFGDIGIHYPEKSIDKNNLQNEIKKVINHISEHKPRLNRLQEMAKSDFSPEMVFSQVLQTYKQAIGIRNHPKHIPILMYHMIVDEPLKTKHRIFVTKKQFDQQLSHLHSKGFKSITFKDYAEFRSGKRPWNQFPKKPIIITFDDGYLNNLTHALPILKKYEMTAVIYLLAQNDLESNAWDNGEIPEQSLMNANQRQELYKSGFFEIGSHGFRHQRITEMNHQEAQHELQESKASLEKEFGIQILSYAFTYGDQNPNIHSELAKKAGYEFALNTDTGALHLEQNPWQIFRVSIFPEDGAAQLWKKTQSWYRKYYFSKRGK